MPTTDINQQVRDLQARVDRLNERDRTFATSLCEQHNNGRALSARQAMWVGILLNRANRDGAAPTAARLAAQTIGNLQGVHQLFATAQGHLRRPAIALRVADFDDIRLALSQFSSDTITITSLDRRGSRGKRLYYGCLRRGAYEPSSRMTTATATAVGAVLRALAERPAEVAAEHGRLTGRCCFCNRHLTDERSTAVGYGPDCAAHYGLAWGDRPAGFAQPVQAARPVSRTEAARRYAAAIAPTRPTLARTYERVPLDTTDDTARLEAMNERTWRQP